MLRGTGTSGGIGIGHALVLISKKVEISDRIISDTVAEKNRFFSARERFISDTENTINELMKKLGDEGSKKTALVLKNQLFLVKDGELEKNVTDRIKNQKMCAEKAVQETCKFYAEMFLAMDSEVMNQRAADINDMSEHIIRILNNAKVRDLSILPENTVIVAKELSPSLTAEMDIKHVCGIVTEKGGDTSHLAIFARALEIPAVLNIENATQKINNEEEIIVDGEYGEIFLKPSACTQKIYKKKKCIYEEKIRELKKYINKDTITADGHKVSLVANITNDGDAAKAMSSGAEGVGLFRTEFLFMNRDKMPDEEEQFVIYKKTAVLCKNKQLTIRTLDIGGDKDIPYMGLSRESNPFLGYRAIRYCLGRSDVFITQLRAIIRASAFGCIRIMIPLVTCMEEILYAKKLISGIMQDFDRKNIKYDKNIKIGIMIETPAAAVMADDFAREVDFFSIGTNDLTQYVMAVDRGNENVAYLYSPYSPAVLRTIRHIIKSAHNNGIEVGMCGEAAAEPGMISLLIYFGLDEFSVTSSRILETRKNIAMWSASKAENVTSEVMKMSSQKDVLNYITSVISAENQTKTSKTEKTEAYTHE